MFSRIIKEGTFVLSSGVKSSYTYEYDLLSDAMNEAYCELLHHKLKSWQDEHGKFNVVVGCETQGIRIGHQLSKLMELPFYIIPKKRIDFAQVGMPPYPKDTHWLIVDDIATTGSTFLRAVEYLEIEEKLETITFARLSERHALVGGRSIATDKSIYPAGALALIFVRKPVLNPDNKITGWKRTFRFVVDQDTGSDIKGPGRADLFFGIGQRPGIMAGSFKEWGEVYYLIKKN